jgi:hypothetical protein
VVFTSWLAFYVTQTLLVLALSATATWHRIAAMLLR